MEKNIEIVIIEDEEDILELIEFHLQKEGYETVGFLSAENVEQFLEEETPSLMIVDRNLPGMEGSEFVATQGQCCEIRQLSDLLGEGGELVAFQVQCGEIRQLSDLHNEFGEFVFSEGGEFVVQV